MDQSLAAIKKMPRLVPLAFSHLPGWLDDDHLAALETFRRSARRIAKKPYKTKALGINAGSIAKLALQTLEPGFRGDENQNAARLFFESNFVPHKIFASGQNTAAAEGFVTGYFEPQVKASAIRTDRFQFPILKRPDDLVEITDNTRPDNIDKGFYFARKSMDGLSEFPDRAAIENGALDGCGLELYWFESRIDIFFIHIQGSARIILPDGSVRRISYDGKSGHLFTPIGKLLIERGEIEAANITMQSVRNWLETYPDEADTLMQQNRSYIFFQEIDHPEPDLGPVAAAGVPLTPFRSLAIDHRLQTFGVPIYVVTTLPLPKDDQPFRRLMIAQDTGSAIVGPARGDLFMGTGNMAGELAGGIRHEADFFALIPKNGMHKQV